MFELLSNSVGLAHSFLEKKLKPGGVAIDATVGNGNDTLYLAELVGKEGRVYGFDIQQQALVNTQNLLQEKNYSDMVKLFHSGHENMKQFVPEQVDVIVFNLGYLPGGVKDITTQPETSLQAVSDGIDLLKPGGFMVLVVYTGHPGGNEEKDCIEEYITSLNKHQFCVSKLFLLNREKAPFLLLIEKNTI